MSRSLAIHFLTCDTISSYHPFTEEDESESDYYLKTAASYEAAVFALVDQLVNVEQTLEPFERISEKDIESKVYEIAKYFNAKEPRMFFRRTYQLLFTSDNGPRLPVFILLLGIDEFWKLVHERVARPFYYPEIPE